MDTAQRGMGLGWTDAQELIRRALVAAKERPGALIACGAGTDHLAPGPEVSIDDVIGAYEMQIEAVEKLGGRIILMASRALAQAARGPADYERVYDRILSQVREPVIIHWLGEMFDPALADYWGDEDHGKAMQTCLDVVAGHADKVDGVKISLLSKEKEIAMRRRLAQGVRMYTGDDFNYAELIDGDGQGYSDALLGIFDAIAPAASAALVKLADGDRAGFHELLAPTVPLSRHVFKAPTRFYKTGVVFLAYLNGLQDHFVMIGGQQSARSLVHLAELFRLADAATGGGPHVRRAGDRRHRLAPDTFPRGNKHRPIHDAALPGPGPSSRREDRADHPHALGASRRHRGAMALRQRHPDLRDHADHPRRRLADPRSRQRPGLAGRRRHGPRCRRGRGLPLGRRPLHRGALGR
jgi:hypothetical protein